MRIKALVIAVSFLSAGLILAAAWHNHNSRVTSTDLTRDDFLGPALVFSHAVYVKDWDSVDAGFALACREEDGTYRLRNNGADSSKAFNRLAMTGWRLLFSEIRATGQVSQDTQILTGSRKAPDNKPTFVIAFRGSDKREDYLYTNCKNKPIPFESVKNYSLSPGPARITYDMPADTATVTSMIMGAWNAWLSNFRSGSPVLVHRGYAEQVCFALAAKVADPIDGAHLSILEALGKYPSATVIITGHSSGGAAAHILAALAEELGLNRQGRIRTRTFAAAGAFNNAARQRYNDLDIINYAIAGDPILYANDFSGYRLPGVNIVIPAPANSANYSRSVHEMTAYEERLKTH